tara:strand:- start:697 stop:1413 length:717 start_codon:yes stop_codon:yes gene_type:complete
LQNNKINNIPKHLAIIMDGNGRWAQKKDLKRIEGHKEGVKVVKEIVKHSVKLGIEYLTLYTLSKENFQRPVSEVLFLIRLFTKTLDDELNLLLDNNVKFNVIGDLTKIDKIALSKLKRVEKLTKNNSALILNLAISYSGRDEIVNSIKKISDSNYENIDEELVSNYLMTRRMPDPDLLIRTGGEYRISNFLLWQIAYTELYFTEILWPDFNYKDLDKAILNYTNRQRRFGKTSDQINK